MAAPVSMLERVGIYGTVEEMRPPEMAERLAVLGELGYRGLWIGENSGIDAFAQLAFLTAAASKLQFGTAIVPIDARTPETLWANARTVSAFSGGSFSLGVGSSHPGFVEDHYGQAFAKPVERMQAHLERLHAAREAEPAEGKLKILLAALKPRMLALAASSADGIVPYLVTPERVSQMRQILGSEKLIVLSLPVCYATDTKAAAEIARKAMGFYTGAAVYRDSFKLMGFDDDDLGAEPSARLTEAIIATGDSDGVAARIGEFFEAGADQINLFTVTGEPWYECDLDALTEIAAALKGRLS